LNKINVGLVGLALILVIIILQTIFINNKFDHLNENLQIIEKMLEDIDYDLHELEERK
tara:strand:+ start:296 stop:469 length:174 start_codon:yes stop_codon:yes gene_type:complete